MMWIFKHTDKFETISVNLSGLTLEKILSAYTVQDEGSPFVELPWDVNTEELPDLLPASKVTTLDVDVTISLLEKKETVSFWKVVMSLESEVREFEWTCYIVVESTKYFECEKILSKFLSNQISLITYMDGIRYEKLNITSIARHLIGYDDDKAVSDSFIPSNN